MRCGIMGGTFDPIHLGHLVTAQAALHEFQLDSVCFIPSGQPPHKEGVTASEHRYQMTLLATVANPQFQVSRLEIERPGYSYTYDTVQTFSSRFEECTIYFITGADAVHELHKWYRYRELLHSCYFVAATRPGFDLGEVNTLTVQEMECVHLLEVPSLAISSTDIRRRVASGRPIKYLVPSSVEGYIYKHGLYRAQAE